MVHVVGVSPVVAPRRRTTPRIFNQPVVKKKFCIITNQLYEKWLENPSINPSTGRKIKPDGSVAEAYKRYVMDRPHPAHTPKPYQIKSSEQIVRALETGILWVWLADKIGSGKTLTAVMAITQIVKTRPVVICCVNNLVSQWMKELGTGLNAQFSKGPSDRKKRGIADVTVCLPTQLYSILKEHALITTKKATPPLVVIDEEAALKEVYIRRPSGSEFPESRYVLSKNQILFISGSNTRPSGREPFRCDWYYELFFIVSDLHDTNCNVVYNTENVKFDCTVHKVNYTVQLTSYTKLVQNVIDRTLLHNDLREATECVRQQLLKKGVVADQFADIIVMKRLFDMTLIADMRGKMEKILKKKDKEDDVERLKASIAHKEQKWLDLDAAHAEIMEEYSDGCKICCGIQETPHIFPCCQFVVCSDCVDRLLGCPMRCPESTSSSLQALADRHRQLHQSMLTVFDIVQGVLVTAKKCIIVTDGHTLNCCDEIVVLQGRTALARQRQIHEYRFGNTKALAIVKLSDISGIHLVETTDIILLRDACKNDLSQIEGRGKRMGRDSSADLTLHFVDFV